MAISLRGERTLHVQHWDKAATRESPPLTSTHVQSPGSVYLSSPLAFLHAVEYQEAADWENRTIAIQCRILLSKEESDTLSEVELSKNGFHVQLALDLARAVMVLPSLSQVQAFMDRDSPCN